jgi:hypothetical protein
MSTLLVQQYSTSFSVRTKVQILTQVCALQVKSTCLLYWCNSTSFSIRTKVQILTQVCALQGIAGVGRSCACGAF